MAIRRVFTYLGAVFLMSYIIFSNNASAITPIVDVSGFEVISNQRTPYIKCFYSDNTSANSAYCSGNNSKQVTGFDFSPTGQQAFKKGDIVDFYVVVGSAGFTDTYSNTGVFRFASNQYVFQLIDFKEVSSNSIPSFINDNYQYISTGATALHTYNFTFTVIGDYTGYLGINSTNNVPFLSFFGYSSTDSYEVIINNVTIWRNSGAGSSDQQNEINATNDAVDNSQTQGNSSQSDAQTGTASLVSTIGSAVSAITSASPTNCLLNGNMGNFDMGQIDLCANPVPAFVQIISSLILILITVPLCIVLFNRFITLFRSFQG